MSIHDPLRDLSYAAGELVQYCRECDWAQRGHRCELSECPQCGAPLPAELALELGGIALVRGVAGIELLAASGQRVVLENLDLPVVAQFLCRHAEDLRRAAGGGAPAHVRRIDKTREVEGMLDVARRRGRKRPV
ncbi:MAG TPA: hypothetical protein VFL14_16335 [Xanthomonadales bacterium]|nr:hypothetical protein [Xanthomonadales bacterium]